jgi:hypothetical protein
MARSPQLQRERQRARALALNEPYVGAVAARRQREAAVVHDAQRLRLGTKSRRDHQSEAGDLVDGRCLAERVVEHCRRTRRRVKGIEREHPRPGFEVGDGLRRIRREQRDDQ